MKKMFTLIIICLAAVQSHSQSTWGVQAGSNMSIIKSKNQPYVYTSSIHSLQGGIFAELKLYKNLFLKPELLLAGNGGKIIITYNDAGQDATTRLLYLQLPVAVELKQPVGKNLKLLLAAGLYAARGISGSEKGEFSSLGGGSTVNNAVKFTNSTTYEANQVNIKPYDFGYHFSAGVQWQHIQLTARYAHGFTNIYPGDETVYFKNRVFAFTLGYLLEAKKRKAVTGIQK